MTGKKWILFWILFGAACFLQAVLAFFAHQNNDDPANWFNWDLFRFMGGLEALLLTVTCYSAGYVARLILQHKTEGSPTQQEQQNKQQDVPAEWVKTGRLSRLPSGERREDAEDGPQDH